MKQMFFYLTLAILLSSCNQHAKYSPTENSISIIGGRGNYESRESIFKSVVVIKMTEGGYCSGAHIGNRTVVTAAHCFGDLAESSAVRTAKTVIFYKADSGMSLDTSCAVERQIVPSKFDSRLGWKNDLAYLFLENNCALEDKVEFKPFDGPVDTIAKFYVSGFGSHYTNINRPYPSSLKTLEINSNQRILELRQIQRLFGILDAFYGPTTPEQEQRWISDFKHKVESQEHFCFTSNSLQHAPFLGDSGGPLYIEQNGKLLILGVFSHFYFIFNAPDQVLAYCYTRISEKTPISF